MRPGPRAAAPAVAADKARWHHYHMQHKHSAPRRPRLQVVTGSASAWVPMEAFWALGAEQVAEVTASGAGITEAVLSAQKHHFNIVGLTAVDELTLSSGGHKFRRWVVREVGAGAIEVQLSSGDLPTGFAYAPYYEQAPSPEAIDDLVRSLVHVHPALALGSLVLRPG